MLACANGCINVPGIAFSAIAFVLLILFLFSILVLAVLGVFVGVARGPVGWWVRRNGFDEDEPSEPEGSS